ncbi:phosphoglycerol transferase and related protein [Paenibacillus popilliae ATCC 14706]|uniref:Phosphoglycerol transferase and related protein n=1 Tax=Paenibacillus popilliae ATCC 14706 TaxID=1212764 RepID=M9M1D2_PAEPP|nr:phosphoglycerol transferase and related protein [Paenibacillus popilliae ATCC 14706]
MEREATGSSQQTKVLNNEYNVYAKIVLAANDSDLSDYELHQDKDHSDYGQVMTHNTNTRVGDNIKARFKTAWDNYRTTRALLSWAP